MLLGVSSSQPMLLKGVQTSHLLGGNWKDAQGTWVIYSLEMCKAGA